MCFRQSTGEIWILSRSIDVEVAQADGIEIIITSHKFRVQLAQHS